MLYDVVNDVNVPNDVIWRQFSVKVFNFHVVWILMYIMLTHGNMCRYTTHIK